MSNTNEKIRHIVFLSVISANLISAQSVKPQGSFSIAPELCDNSESETSTYNIYQHVVIMILLAVFSGLGCSLTALANRIPHLTLSPFLLTLGRHFGTGVIISTAFVHMLGASVESLKHRCAPSALRDYSSSAMLIALSSALAMHLIELIAQAHFNKRTNGFALVAASSDSEIQLSPISDKPSSHHGHHHHFPMGDQQKDLTTYILELGILSHSIIIGLSLGITTGPQLLPLVFAVLFHQFFEGIGLGARISTMSFDKGDGRGESLKGPLVMVLMFSLTTSLGTGIGILIRTLGHNQLSGGAGGLGLGWQGVLDGVSAGILIYTGLVELVGREMSYDAMEVNHQPLYLTLCNLGMMYAGVTAMAILGNWA